eukprot:1519423-Amphidinium_carterae.2
MRHKLDEMHSLDMLKIQHPKLRACREQALETCIYLRLLCFYQSCNCMAPRQSGLWSPRAWPVRGRTQACRSRSYLTWFAPSI